MPSALGVICAMMFVFVQGSINFSGKWSIPQTGRNGARVVSILTINQAGPTILGNRAAGGSLGSGSSVPNELFGGKVEGDTISFYIWRGLDKPAKQFYKGVMHGDEIDFTVSGGPAPNTANPSAPPPVATMQIVAKRTAE